MSDKPLSALVAAGWEMTQYSASVSESGVMEHCFLLRKGRDHKLLKVRKKMLGEGLVVEELEV
jgi:hypothetical protein